ncbi:methyltransferase [Methanosarcina sp. 2.H.T.1A.6]|uniref:methyltransferase n=1 Tax=unclassified Methanosarcina TaxID=2644672 RepID=UPI0006219C43|nr:MULTISPECIES: methyltransferase [unclassified Methanosarcina]KKG14675.1 methyltransferase [Methanosarcina sp. 2.H.T.1A.3]KKG16306.1 methyltransferase [Methanosarcina sp. 2.H.T.1A.15]KKG22181.1 methyltransferase [Methanosarcina sp. 2.H.T.1A.8]KKG24537.1 methyltransferase [Methanosarcina sp. 2.H.T.1A.6]
MKKLPEIIVPLTRIYEMSLAPVMTNAMVAGVELAIFDQLIKPVRAEELAEKCGFNAKMTAEYLNVLTACGLVIKKDGFYQNSPEAEQYLVTGRPTYYGDLILFEYDRLAMSPKTIAKRVKNGPAFTEEGGMNSEEFWVRYARSMANWERSGTAQKVADIISALPEFSSMKKMLDLGGGPGLVGIAVLSRHPSMEGVVFDQPAVVNVTEEFVAEYGLSDRITTIGGDYLNDPLGGGYDLILASCTLNFARDCMDKVVKKIYDALNPGGTFVSLHDGLYDEGTKPSIHVLNMMPSALSGYNCSLRKGLIVNSMLNAGFQSVRSQTINFDAGPLDIDIARKNPEWTED